MTGAPVGYFHDKSGHVHPISSSTGTRTASATTKDDRARQKALRGYQGGASTPINVELRTGVSQNPSGGPTNPMMIDVVKHLDMLVALSPVTRTTIVHRGMSGNVPAELRAKDPDTLIGKSFVDNGFGSFSTSADAAKQYAHWTDPKANATIVSTELPVGSYALDVGARTNKRSGLHDEHEVLLPRGTRHTITNARRAHGVTYISTVADTALPDEWHGNGNADAGTVQQSVPLPLPDDQAKSVDGMKHYLQQVDTLMSAAGMRDSDMHTTEQLVLQHGKPFAFDESSFKGRRGTAHQCFKNATNGTLHKNLTYVEGYVDVGIPIHHAWNVDDRGHVIDPTLKGNGVHGYYGIPFKREYVMNTAVKTRVYGVLGYTNKDLMTGVDKPSEFHADAPADGAL